MNLHEDFEDEPAVEERMPFGITPEEMHAAMVEASLELCKFCNESYPSEDWIETGMHEYCTMDSDPGTFACPECLEAYRMRFIPDDPSLFDCLTPVAIG